MGNFQRMGTGGGEPLDLACMVYAGTKEKYFLHTPSPALGSATLPHAWDVFLKAEPSGLKTY